MEAEKFADRYRVPSARWAGYDYGQNGLYFVTICTKNRNRFFGEIILPTGNWEEAVLQPTAQALIAQACWLQIPTRFPFVSLHGFVLMPDHLHGLMLFDKPQELTPALDYQNTFGPQRDNLAAVIRGFKAGVTALTRKQDLAFEWQSRFHDRVVRNEQEALKIQRYITENPVRWKHEQFQEEGVFR
jgi:putative transposase